MNPLIRLLNVSFYFLIITSLPGILTAQINPDDATPKYQIPNVKYPTAETFVITYNIMDYQGADNTGKTDQAPLIKKLLKKMEASTAEQAGGENCGKVPARKVLWKGRGEPTKRRRNAIGVNESSIGEGGWRMMRSTLVPAKNN